MLIVWPLVMWVIAAPAGYVVGRLAEDYYEDTLDNGMFPWLCACVPPLAAVVALTLIMKETK